jgi:hypothetical protein
MVAGQRPRQNAHWAGGCMTEATLVKDLNWTSEELMEGEDTIFRVHVPDVGRFTVLDRLTGFGHRDIETGFKDLENKFWLASGQKDIRDLPDFTITQAVDWVKRNANNCIGV